MAALLAILMFIAFATLDYLISRKRGMPAMTPAAPPMQPIAKPAVMPADAPVWVAGYELPEQLHYHQGHTWAYPLSADTVAVGVDDFARRLTGTADSVKLPKVGTHLLQGGPAFAIANDGREAAFVAPVEGEVLEINEDVAAQPSLSTDEPYTRGWLFKLRAPFLAANMRNLLSGSMARRWIEDARDQLELRLMALSGSVLQDGGEPAPDFARHLDDADWQRLVERFLMSPTGGEE